MADSPAQSPEAAPDPGRNAMDGSLGLSLPEPLATSHDRKAFDCGSTALDDFLKRYALQNQERDARTFVTHRGGVVMGYYTLAAAVIEYDTATVAVARNLARHRPIPAVLLARLAVDRSMRGQGVGSSLLLDALQRYLVIVQHLGSRAMLVHAKDDQAAAFYRRYGFEPSPASPLHLQLVTQDIRKAVAGP